MHANANHEAHGCFNDSIGAAEVDDAATAVLFRTIKDSLSGLKRIKYPMESSVVYPMPLFMHAIASGTT